MPYRPVIGIVFDPNNANSPYHMLLSRLINEHEINVLQLDCRYFNEAHLNFLVKENMSLIDGLLLPGSPVDIPSELYGEQRNSKWCYAKNTALIEYQEKMILEGKKCGLPILGICHGSNVLNLINGGKIEQDITALEQSEKIDHDVFPLKGDLAHSVTVKIDTHLHDILSGNDIERKKQNLIMKVNSWHHTANKNIPENFVVSAIAPDGTIEAIEEKYPGNSNCWGIQFHPEYIDKIKDPLEYQRQSRIFRSFNSACLAYHQKRCFNRGFLQNFKSLNLRKITSVEEYSPIVEEDHSPRKNQKLHQA